MEFGLKRGASLPLPNGGRALTLAEVSGVGNAVPDAFMCPARQMMLDSVSMATSVISASATVDGAGTTSRRTVNRITSVK